MNPVVHFELPAEDRKRASAFYAKAFGWNMNQLGPEMGNYVLAMTTDVDANNMPTTPGTINGGLYQKDMTKPGQQHPSVVISVEDIHESMNNVTKAGGKTFGKPMEIPGVGTFIAFQDTEGNFLSMLQPQQ